ncbi:DUF1189 family protein [uncultured Clostridium sp.]|uniref:DUF1189 family protein n=1 Tax=uncultured Clostridium sp. TaxID=59620 RepID=UPI0025E78D89|nr:DUF1189 family protein [uncultured Clostridium sp.]
MDKKSNVIRKFLDSINDVYSFRDFVREGLLRAVLYSLIFSIVIGGARGVVQVNKFNDYLNSTIKNLNEDKYNFKIENDKLDIATSPIKIREKDTLIYVDKDVKIDESNSINNVTKNENTYLLILQDGMIIGSGLENELEMNEIKIKYSDINIVEDINNESVIKSINDNRNMTMIIIFITMIVKEFILWITASIFIAILSIIPSRLLKVNLGFNELTSLSIYAYTLPNVIVLILNILIPDVAFDTAIMVGTLAYNYLILRNIKVQNEDDIKL